MGSEKTDERCVDRSIGTERSVGAKGPDPDRLIAALAEGQHGIVARRQLRELGLSDDRIDGRVRRGRLHVMHRGVYAVGFRIATMESRWMAAVLGAGPAAVLSHRSAGQLWRLVPRSAHSLEVTRPAYLRPTRRVRGHRASLPDDERTSVEGIPVTTAPRTILDFAAVASPRQVELALNEMEVRRLTDRLSIPDLLARYPGRRGSAILRALLAEHAEDRGVTRRELEERFAAMVDARGLPRPRRNADIAVRGRFFNVDCLWPDEQLVVELDSRTVHGTHRAFEADRERDRLMLTEGWRVIRVTWRQLCDRESAVAADLRTALSGGRALR